MQRVNSLFSPKSVAVIGVSQDGNKIGSVVLNNLIKAGYKGKLYPINPKHKTLFDQKVYPNLAAIDDEIDLAVVAIPAKFVKQITQEAVKARVKNLVIISAGFSEVGEEGAKLEQEIHDIAKEGDVRIVGPNCLGIINTQASLNASFASHMPKKGNIAFMSQSGAINTALLDLALSRNLGFSHFVSLGNKVDINEIDLIKEWMNDDSVHVIGVYIEEFASGKQLVNMLKDNYKKPVVVLYAGKSREGQKAASSHTGAMTSDRDVVETGLKQAGVTVVSSIEKLFNALMMFSWIDDIPVGHNVAIVTNAGGPGIMMTDLLSTTSARIVELSEETRNLLDKELPAASSTLNPVDILGDAKADRYTKVLDILSKAPEVDLIMTILTPQYVTEIYETSRTIISAIQQYSKPIVPVFIGEFDVSKGLSLMWKNSVPAYRFAEEAVAAVDALLRYTDMSRVVKEINKLSPSTKKKNEPKRPLSDEINKLLSSENVALSPQLTAAMAVEFNIRLPVEKVVNTVEEAISFADGNGYPIVMKATTEDVIHKTDTNLVHLGVANKTDLIVKFNELRANITAVTGHDNPGILIQEMVVGDEELIIGAKRDGPMDGRSGFGHLLMFGKGGVYTSVYEDKAHRLIPISREEISTLIHETKVSRILHGVRGRPPLSMASVIDILDSVQKMLIAYPQISSMDINPLMVTKERAVGVDLRIFVRK